MEHRSVNIEHKEIISLLEWYIESGVDESSDEQTIDFFARSRQPHPQEISGSALYQKSQNPVMPVLLPVEKVAQDAQQQAAKCRDLTELHHMIRNFDGCRLKKTATHTVFSDGNPDSTLMVIGDLPGSHEDRQGKAFAGESGQLLDRMMAAIGLSRKQDFYVTNILPWRPPGNRPPTREEITICLPFIKRHIELFNPDLIILLGGTTATHLLKSTLNITRLQGKWQTYNLKDRKIPVRPLFHPIYLQKHPRAKGKTWQDLLEIKVKIKDISQ